MIYLLIIISSIFYGITMKIADLLDEHGLKWFKGSNIIFGFLWGIFGSILVYLNPVIGNILIAMNLAFLVRNRLDYLNHQIAASLIIITFLLTTKLNLELFLIFYIIFLIFGSIKDFIGDKTKKKGIILILTESALYYPISTLIYSIIYNNWIIFISLTLFTTSYNITTIVAKKYGYK